MPILSELLGLLRPASCLGCGQVEAWPCCADCLPASPPWPGPLRLVADPTLPLWTLGPYTGGLRDVVVAGKLRGQAAALELLGRRLGVLLATGGAGADLVTWVASRPGRHGRPRDHARILAHAVGGQLGLPVVGLLAPAAGADRGLARHAGALPTGPSRPARARRGLVGGRVLVVDDVATSGQTLAGAAAALRLAGARRVEVATVAAAASGTSGSWSGWPV